MPNHIKLPSTPTALKPSRGFTLIELMITLVILGILTTLAWSTYDTQSRKNRRSEGVRALMEASSLMEKCYVNNNTYAGCNIPAESERGHYSLAASHTDPTEDYTLTATPQNAQADDDKCTSLTINHVGQRGHTGAATTTRRCWGE
jgi:type IV pilus assembly protein PilE